MTLDETVSFVSDLVCSRVASDRDDVLLSSLAFADLGPGGEVPNALDYYFVARLLRDGRLIVEDNSGDDEVFEVEGDHRYYCVAQIAALLDLASVIEDKFGSGEFEDQIDFLREQAVRSADILSDKIVTEDR